MIKKLKKARPSVIFQLVVVVALFNYRGCSTENEGLEDMSYGDKAVSGYLKPLLLQDKAVSGKTGTANPAVAVQPGSQREATGYFLKQFVTLPYKGQMAAGNTPVLPIIAAAYYLK